MIQSIWKIIGEFLENILGFYVFFSSKYPNITHPFFSFLSLSLYALFGLVQ